MSDLPFDLSLSEDQRMTRESLQRFAREVLRARARSPTAP